MNHEMRLTVYYADRSAKAFYLAYCPCGWTSDKGGSTWVAERYKEHVKATRTNIR